MALSPATASSGKALVTRGALTRVTSPFVTQVRGEPRVHRAALAHSRGQGLVCQSC